MKWIILVIVGALQCLSYQHISVTGMHDTDLNFCLL